MEPAGTHLDRALDASSRREAWARTTHPRRISRRAADRPAVVCRDARRGRRREPFREHPDNLRAAGTEGE
jgi:hypothetical protein